METALHRFAFFASITFGPTKVRRVFDLYTCKRLGTRTIAQQLADEGAPAPSAGWSHPAVHWIISNPTFVGKIRWRNKVFDGVHEPLVDEFTFAKAQAILRERSEHAKRRGNASNFLLSGLLRCGRCGKAYIGMSANGNGGRYHQALARAEERRPELEQRLASISAEITRAEQALERYYEAFEQGTLSAEGCEQRVARLQARLEELRAQEAELSLQAPHEGTHAPTPADLAAVADHLEQVVAEAAPQRAKALLRLLIEELRVNNRAEIQPTYRLVTPTVCAMSEKVGGTGIEPSASCL